MWSNRVRVCALLRILFVSVCTKSHIGLLIHQVQLSWNGLYISFMTNVLLALSMPDGQQPTAIFV
jgi:hypothetical protein